jgi:uncharacterized protein
MLHAPRCTLTRYALITMSKISYQIASLLVHVHIPDSQSLKDKRMVLRSLKDKVRAKFNVSVSELDGENKWQTAALGFAFVGNDRRHLESCLQSVLSFIETFPEIQICNSQVEFR